MITRQSQLAMFTAALGLFALGSPAGPVSPALAQEPAAQGQQNQQGQQGQQSEVRLPAIVVTSVTDRPLTDSILASGSIRPVQEIFVQPLVDGLSIKSLSVDVGDRVKAGDVVAELNKDALLLQKSQLEANKAKAEAALAQNQAQVIEAQATANDANRQRDRAINLSRNGTLSTSQLEQQTASAEAAAARLNAARQLVNVAQADIKVVEAQIDDIDLKLDRTDVKAPVDGVISVKDAKVGAIATGAGTPLFTMIRNGEIELVADVPESDIRRIRVDMPAKVTIAGTREAVPGKVRLVSPVVDPANRLGSVHILVDAASGAKSGMYASARIIIEETTAPTLPQSAVTTERTGTIVRKVEDNVVKQVKVETGIQDEGFVQILSGLQPGDLVVAKAGAFVRDGDRINPVRDEPAASN
ncbi:efflux RND transporter periplasmic adaptor subunit [Rhizobium sp. SSA_523]|uniref:efflux RND transporter periplasmic adaptor subunit n=1 Tax=Rhizobium sp. SSA_523 TaxID=2952477 RepID=UPI002091DC9D|nr:efflux RND transporter periplasmic adaptor subunit [Rhizobium sp. SSA_523]MCO5732109.1 efflux RND transporter periplasmic adaptor subunit [Rhizobium sp. SSA_523]WKC25645.1 efflux RND transporter periplasmic adaptor subunit [Rhizobium sp. SSA_523]